MSRTPRSAPITRLLAVLAAALVVVGLGATTAAAKPAAPQLEITVTDGQDAAAPKDHLDYTVSVRNLGGAVRGLLVTQSVPDGAKASAVRDRGVRTRGTVTWTVDLKAGQQVELRSRLTVADRLPTDLLRLATVACAKTSAKAAPTVCASDSDLLPAGAVAATQAPVPPTSAAPEAVRGWWPYAAAGAGLVVVVGVVVALLVARRRRRGGPGADRVAAEERELVSSDSSAHP